MINNEEVPLIDGIWFTPNINCNPDGINIKNYVFKSKLDVYTGK